MNRYDLVFAGYLGTYTVVPFRQPSFVGSGGPVVFSAVAAARVRRGIGMVTKASESEAHIVELIKEDHIHVFVQHRQTPRYRAVFPSANVDERQVFLLRGAENFVIDDMPPIEPCLVHLAGWHLREFSIEFMQALRERGFRLSVDLQGFMWEADHETGAFEIVDIPEKMQIFGIADFVKLDSVEAKVLTGTDVLQDQADMLEDWGSPETIITRSDGALVKSKGITTFAKFTNKKSVGRMGRGDTLMGSYLARRLDHSIEASLQFAAALTSIKLESPGPFGGCLDDVIARMRNTSLSNNR